MEACIITGASSGIGKAIATRLLQRGMTVFGVSREPRKAHMEHPNYEPMALDLSDIHAIKGVAQEILSRERSIKILINNAGVGAFGPHDTLDAHEIQNMVMVNLVAPMVLTRHLLGRLRAKKGHVIFIASVTALGPTPMGAVYGAAKAGIRHFARSLFEENRKAGLKVHTILPDITATPFFSHLSFGPALDEHRAYLLPEDVADAVEYALGSRDAVVVQEILLRPQIFRLERR